MTQSADSINLDALHEILQLAVLKGEMAAARTIVNSLERLAVATPNLLLSDWLRTEIVQFHVLAGAIGAAWADLRRLACLARAPFLDDFQASETAWTQWESALPVQPHPAREDFLGRLYLTLAQLCAADGEYTGAALFIQRSLGLKPGPEALGLQFRVLVETGTIHSPRLSHISAALEPLHQTPLVTALDYLDAQADLAWLRTELGASLASRERLWGLCVEHELWRAVLHCAAGLAHTLLRLGQYDRSRQILDFGDPLAEALGDPFARLKLTRLRAKVDALAARQAQGNVPSIEEIWNTDSEEAARRPPDPAILPVRTTASFAAWQLDWLFPLEESVATADVAGAHCLLQAMQPEFSRSDSELVRLRLDYSHALLLHSQKEYREAADLLMSNYTEAERLSLPACALDSFRLLGRCLATGATVSRGLFSRYRQMLRTAAGTLGRVDRWMWEADLASDNDLWLSSELQRLDRHNFRAVARFLYQASRSREEFYFRFGRVAPGDRQMPRSLDPGPPGQALVSLVSLGRQTLSVILYRGVEGQLCHRAEVSDAGQAQIASYLKTFHKRFQLVFHDALSPADTVCAELLDGLAELLCWPALLDGLPAHVNAFTFHPDSLLASVPFAALPFQGRPLIESCPVTVRPILARSDAVPFDPSGGRMYVAAVRHAALAFDVPQPGDAPPINRIEWLRGLPAFRQLELVEPGPAELLDRACVVRNLPTAHIFHFFGHGNFDADWPERTGLVLVPKPGKAEVLSVADIAGLKTPALGLVCLACCMAGDTYHLPTGWSVGVVHAFLRAGAGQVLACLWPARGDVAGELVAAFYQHLATSSPPEALQLAQQDLAVKYDKTYGREYDMTQWAGWQLYCR